MIEAAQLKGMEKKARRAVYRLVGNNADVDDIMQEMYLRLHVAQLSGTLDMQGMMITVARNLARDLVRHQRFIRRFIDPMANIDVDGLPSNTNIERSSIAWEELRLISEFANTLSQRQREAFVLLQVLGYSQYEVARMMDPPTTPAAVESLINVVGRKGWRQRVTEYQNEAK